GLRALGGRPGARRRARRRARARPRLRSRAILHLGARGTGGRRAEGAHPARGRLAGRGARPVRNEVRTFMEQALSRRRRGPRQVASFLVGAALLIAACSIRATPSPQTASGLKPIDPAALQALVDKTVQELLVPGAVVLLRTPQGDFTAASGTTQ